MSTLKLLWRQFSSQRWPALILAVSVALLSAIAAVTPRLMANLDDRQLSQELAGLSAIQGDVSGSWLRDPVWGPGPATEDAWAPHRGAFSAIRDAQPEPLRGLLTAPQFLAEQRLQHVHTPPVESGYYRTTLFPIVDPDLAEHAELVAGAWPELPAPSPDGVTLFEIAINETAATKMGWAVGTEIDGVARVSGIFRPLDPDAKRSQHVPLEYTVHEVANPDRGLALEMGVFLPPNYLLYPATFAANGVDPFSQFNMSVWYGTEPAKILGSGIDIATLSSQLTALLAQSYPVAAQAEGGPVPDSTRLRSELGASLSKVAAQQATTRALLAVAAAGPIAVGIALVALSARLVIQRRRQWLDLVNARGLSHRELHRLAFAEGLLLALPAAVVGQLAAELLVPGPTSAWAWLPSALVAVVAAGLLAWSTGSVGQRGRSDLSAAGGRWRLVAEALVLIGALAALWRVFARPSGGVDLLTAATPVFLALAACLLVLRLYPLPLRLLGGWLRRRRGLTGFLGAARALRDPAGGTIPVVTVLLGSTLAVMSATLLGTITTGTERATWEVNGSSIHVSGPRIYDETLAQLQGLDGVAAVARIHDAGDNVPLFVGDERVLVNLLLASGDLQGAYGVAPSGSPVPDAVFGDGGAAVVVGAESGVPTGPATLQGVGEVRVVGQLRALPGVATGANWALADANRWQGEVPGSVLAMIAVRPGADVAAVAEEVRQLLPNSRIATVSAEIEQLRESATVAGLSQAFGWFAIATAALLALAVFGAQLLTGGERNHLAAILRTLGIRPLQLRALTAWEVGPAVVVALVVGVGLGIGLAWLMLAALDFSAITGGINSPELYLHAPSLGAVVGGLAAAVAVAIAASAWQASRANLAQELRIGETR